MLQGTRLIVPAAVVFTVVVGLSVALADRSDPPPPVELPPSDPTPPPPSPIPDPCPEGYVCDESGVPIVPIVTEVPVPEPYVINGITIPLPDGAWPGGVHRLPGGWAHLYEKGDSNILFSLDGRLIVYQVSDSERENFQPAVEALHEAAPPLIVGGVEIPVPLGAAFQESISPEPVEGWLGVPEQGPHLNVISRGESWVSFDREGGVVASDIRTGDEGDFSAIVTALQSAR